MTELIAHRGFADDNPENTLGAFRAAAADATMIELDVRLCGTGEVVVFHDDTLERATGQNIVVGETAYDELAECDIFGSGEGVPRLTDVFDTLPEHVGVNVELKTVDVADAAVRIAADVSHNVLVSSFHDAAMSRVAATSMLTRAYLFTEEEFVEEEVVEETHAGAIDRAVQNGYEAIHPPKEVVSKAFVEEAHDHGLTVNSWTVKTAAEASRLVDAGVDGIIADSPSVLKRE